MLRNTVQGGVAMDFKGFDPETATLTFLPCGCVKYPQLGIISMGETSKNDLSIISGLIEKYSKQ